MSLYIFLGVAKMLVLDNTSQLNNIKYMSYSSSFYINSYSSTDI